MTSKQARK